MSLPVSDISFKIMLNGDESAMLAVRLNYNGATCERGFPLELSVAAGLCLIR